MLEVDVGDTIGGKYKLLRKVGAGAMGEVWAARHETLDGEYAVKILHNTDEAMHLVERFRSEGQIAARLSKKTRHIVRVTDHGEEKGVPYLVMELLEGRSLEQVLLRTGRMPPPAVAVVISQIAAGLSAAHAEGVLHRDLKPANIFLTRDDRELLLVKILDFGIARQTGALGNAGTFKTSAGILVGSPAYMSPEQARGIKTLDARSDVWALGVLAYEALTRRIPFDGETVEDILVAVCTRKVVSLHQRSPDLPSSLASVFSRAFADDLALRFQTATDFARALSEALNVRSPDLSFDEFSAMLTESSNRETMDPPPMPSAVFKKDKKQLGVIASAVGVVAILGVGITLALSPKKNAATNEAAASSTAVPSSTTTVPPVLSALPTTAIVPSTAVTASNIAPSQPPASAAPSARSVETASQKPTANHVPPNPPRVDVPKVPVPVGTVTSAPTVPPKPRDNGDTF